METGITPSRTEVEKAVPPTLIAVILDESGSMGNKWDEVIQGYNQFLEEQRTLPDSCRISITKFNTVCSLLHPPTPLVKAPSLGKHNYIPAGMTALFDAIAETVRVAQNHKQAEERVLCLIITDGQENSSRETTGKQVTDLIKAKEAEGDWTFVYLGVTPEQFVEQLNLSGTRLSTNAAVYESAIPNISWKRTSQSAQHYRRQHDRTQTDFFKKKPGSDE